MADFESELTAMFRAEADPALGARLADAAINQIDHEDRRRQLILTTGGLVGVGAAAIIVGGSGVLGLLKSAALAAPHVSAMPWLWPTAAVALALYATTYIKAARTA